MPAAVPANQRREADHEGQDPDGNDEQLGSGRCHEAGVTDWSTDGDVPVDADCDEVVDRRSAHPHVHRQPDATPTLAERPVVQYLKKNNNNTNKVDLYTAPKSSVV